MILLCVSIAFVVYPSFVVFGSLAAVRLLPEKPRAKLQQFMLNSIGFDRESNALRASAVRSLNQSNKSIDGSIAMEFRIANNASKQEYFVDVERTQVLTFTTFQKPETRALMEPRCIIASAPRADTKIGSLAVETFNGDFSEQFPVRFSAGGLRLVGEIDDERWKRVKSELGHIQFHLYFVPDDTFLKLDYFACQDLSIFVTMTFKKVKQPESPS